MTFSCIDVAQAKHHLCLLEPLTNSSHIWLATDDSSRKGPAKALVGPLDALLPQFRAYQEEGYAIHVCINAMRAGRRRNADAQRIRTVYAEMDNEPRKAFPIPASLIVRTSPGRAHWYWLTDPVDPPTISEARAMQRTIVAHYGADAHAADIARVLRLAGTWHQKGRPHLVSIVEGSGYRYRRGQLLEAFPPARDRSAPGPVAFGEKLERYKTAAIWGIVAEVVAAPPGCRNSTLNKAAFRLGQLGFSLAETAALLSPPAISIGLGEREIATTIRSGHRAGAAPSHGRPA